MAVQVPVSSYVPVKGAQGPRAQYRPAPPIRNRTTPPTPIYPPESKQTPVPPPIPPRSGGVRLGGVGSVGVDHHHGNTYQFRPAHSDTRNHPSHVTRAHRQPTLMVSVTIQFTFYSDTFK